MTSIYRTVGRKDVRDWSPPTLLTRPLPVTPPVVPVNITPPTMAAIASSASLLSVTSLGTWTGNPTSYRAVVTGQDGPILVYDPAAVAELPLTNPNPISVLDPPNGPTRPYFVRVIAHSGAGDSDPVDSATVTY